MNSLRVLYQKENLSELLDKNNYDLMTVISYVDLGLESMGFKLRHKKLANIYLDGTLEEILNRFTRTTRQEVQQTYDISDLVFKIGDPDIETTYNLYRNFEKAQGRKPWGKETFSDTINFNAYYKGELVASVPCYDLNPYLQVRAIFSKRLNIEDKVLYKIIGKATRRLIFEICKYGKERGCEFVSLGSVNYGTAQKSNVADFKMFFGPRLGDEYTYIYRSRWLAFIEMTKVYLSSIMLKLKK